MNHNTLELSSLTCITTHTNTSLHRQPQTRDAALWLQVLILKLFARHTTQFQALNLTPSGTTCCDITAANAL